MMIQWLGRISNWSLIVLCSSVSMLRTTSWRWIRFGPMLMALGRTLTFPIRCQNSTRSAGGMSMSPWRWCWTSKDVIMIVCWNDVNGQLLQSRIRWSCLCPASILWCIENGDAKEWDLPETLPDDLLVSWGIKAVDNSFRMIEILCFTGILLKTRTPTTASRKETRTCILTWNPTTVMNWRSIVLLVYRTCLRIQMFNK